MKTRADLKGIQAHWCHFMLQTGAILWLKAHCEIKHIVAGNKAYLGRARGTRWRESAGELREWHLGLGDTSLAGRLGLSPVASTSESTSDF
jgi:hypothetical protein